MKLICAGYPKTGSKSCSSALRTLGYNVADYMETMEFLSIIWRDYLLGKGLFSRFGIIKNFRIKLASIDDVISEYEKHGFDTNQDIPGNLLWQDLYEALIKRDSNTKVILTIRDNDEVWWRSWCNFMKQEVSRNSFAGICFQGYSYSFK